MGKVLKSVGQAVGGAVRGVARVTKQVLDSKAFQLATTALSFVPGLNAVGIAGKALSVLGKAGAAQKWMTTGLRLFDGLRTAHGLAENVMQLAGGKGQPLGPLTRLLGAAASSTVADFARLLAPRLGTLGPIAGIARELAGNFRIPPDLAQKTLPEGWSPMTREIREMEHCSCDQLYRAEQLQARMQDIELMLRELSAIDRPAGGGIRV